MSPVLPTGDSVSTMSQPPQQQQQTPPVPPEVASLEEDSNSILPAVIAVLAAAVAFSAAGKVLSGSLKTIARVIGLPALIGAALAAVAQRAIMKQIGAARSQRVREALTEAMEDAIEKAVEDGYDTLAQAVEHVVDMQRRAARRPASKLKTSAPGEAFEDVDEVIKPSPHFEDPKVLAKRTAQTVRSAAVQHVATGASGLDFRKVWHSVNDNRVRPSHAFLGSPKYEFHSIGINEQFVTIHGNTLMFPGDPVAPIEETARCRCWMTIHPSVSTGSRHTS